MEKRKRNAGEGLLRQRKDGRWEGRIVIGYDDKNLPITQNVTSKSKTECERKLRELRDSLSDDIVKSSDDVTFGEWIDKWYRDYVKPFVKPKLPNGLTPLSIETILCSPASYRLSLSSISLTG